MSHAECYFAEEIAMDVIFGWYIILITKIGAKTNYSLYVFSHSIRPVCRFCSYDSVMFLLMEILLCGESFRYLLLKRKLKVLSSVG